MKRLFFNLLPLLLLSMTCFGQQKDMKQVIDKGLSAAVSQYSLMADSFMQKKDSLPRTTDRKGKMVSSDSRWWTSGFFPGTLWYLYEVTGEAKLRGFAEEFTSRVEREQYTTSHHDVGFMLYCSFGNGLRITGNQEYKQVLMQGAKSLITRYDDNVKLIRSWNSHKDIWQYPVIIDNMMNLELLCWATNNSNVARYTDIAINHADNTMKYHYRPDNSCYHVVSYDTVSGLPEKKQTAQGYADHTAWARGQAWGLYGYTMMFRETGRKEYLKQAERIAKYLIKHPNMPEDMVPYWDFDAPNIPQAYRDASAAAIMASALLELSKYTSKASSKQYIAIAEKQLRSLTSDEYLAATGSNANFILKHSVGNLPKKSEVDVPLTYADYYYVEALTRYKQMFL